MNRTFIPKGAGQRIALAIALLMAVVTAVAWKLGETLFTWIALAGTLTWLVNVLLLKESAPSNPSVDEYSQTIKTISQISTQLSKLSTFLEKERTRVADTEATIKKLNEERSKLEPLVNTQRETVDAILAAHAERAANRAWRERFIGFSLGLGASLLASLIYGYLRR